MNPALRAAALASLLALTCTGCGTNAVTARIQEKAAVFARLTPAQQEQIKHGGIEPGYTQDMVYMALGQPNKITTSANGRDTTWVYKNYIAPVASPQANFQWSKGVYGGSAHQSASRESNNVSTGNAIIPQQYQPAAMSSTAPAGPEPSMEVPDLPTGTFYVTFRRNRVIDLRIDE